MKTEFRATELQILSDTCTGIFYLFEKLKFEKGKIHPTKLSLKQLLPVYLSLGQYI